jgi:hypothetical protein
LVMVAILLFVGARRPRLLGVAPEFIAAHLGNLGLRKTISAPEGALVKIIRCAAWRLSFAVVGVLLGFRAGADSFDTSH